MASENESILSATLSVKLMKDIFKSSPTREELYALIDLWDSKKPNISDSTSSNFLFQEVLKILSVKVEDEDRYSITLIEDNQTFKLSVSTMDFEYLMRAEQLLQKTANIIKIKQKGKIRPETLNMLSSRVSRETNHLKSVHLDTVILSSALSVESCINVLKKAVKWQIEVLHCRDHELKAFLCVRSNGCVMNLHIHLTGPYFEEITHLAALFKVFERCYFILLDSAAWQTLHFDMEERVIETWEDDQEQKRLKGGLGGGTKERLWRLICDEIAKMLCLPATVSQFFFDQTFN